MDGPELLGFEVLYLPLAVDQELQGRGLDAADGEDVAGASEADRVGAGRVHAHDPIRLPPAPRRVFERLHGAPIAQGVEPVPDRLVGERGDPEPQDRLPATRETVQVGEDELPLPTRVAGVDHLRHGRILHQPLDDAKLLARLVAHPDLEALRQDRQALQTPLLVLLAVGIGRRQLRQMPERPRNGPTVTGQGTFPLPMPPQRPRYIPPDGRLLRNDKPHTNEYTDTKANSYNKSVQPTAPSKLTDHPKASEAEAC